MMKVAILCGMKDFQVETKISPIVNVEEVETVYLIRRQPLHMPGVISYTPPRVLGRVIVLAELYRVFVLLWLCLMRKVDIIVAFYFIPHGLYAGVIGRLFRIPVIQALIGADLNKTLASKPCFNVLNQASYIAVRGNPSKQQLVATEIGPERIFTPPNVFNLDAFRSTTAEKIYDLIYVGDFVEKKQVNKLLSVVQILRRQFLDIQIALIGDGPKRNCLEQFVREFTLDGTVHFLGRQPRKKVADFLNQSRVFIMVSRDEGLPMAMVEAMSCGLPVVVPNDGDITDVAVHNVNALIVDPPTEIGFANAIKSLMEDQDLYDRLKEGAMKTREFFSKEYSLQAAIRIWKQVLE